MFYYVSSAHNLLYIQKFSLGWKYDRRSSVERLKYRKTAIWCDDQGNLAFCSPAIGAEPGDRCFEAGDMIEFDIEISQDPRIAQNITHLKASFGTALTEVLQEAVHPDMDKAGQQNTVIPFCKDAFRSRKRPTPSTQHRWG